MGSIQSDDSFSIFSLCTKLILEGRDEANFSSPFHMWGFQTCGKLMTKQAQSDWSIGLDEIECNYVLGVINPKNFKNGTKNMLRQARQSLEHRPFLRSLQIRSTTNCFLNDDDYFHQKFDFTFATTFVIPSLSDVSPLVQNTGIISVSAALKLLPSQGKIVNDALQALVPLPSFDKGKLSSSFKAWAHSHSDTLSNDEYRSWKELQLSLESDAML